MAKGMATAERQRIGASKAKYHQMIIVDFSYSAGKNHFFNTTPDMYTGKRLRVTVFSLQL